MHILIVDDFPEDQQALIAMIEEDNSDFTFDTAQTGDEAVAAFGQHRHDCVIVDYRLNHENGLDILARLKTIDPFCAAIVMSGQGSEKIAADAMKSGAFDYLVKGNTSGFAIRTIIHRTVERCEVDRKASVRQQEQNQFLTTLVHDIRAPFRNISNSTAMLIEDIENGSFADIDSLVRAQSEALKHADALIKTLQTYALLDDEVDFERVSLNYIFELLTKMFRTDANVSNAEFEIEVLPDIDGHAPQIGQLFQNLIANALKYNVSDVQKVNVRLIAANKDAVTICVEDNGLGMEAASIEDIFKPLTRLWSKDEYEGTGLGLSICKKIVERHQGRIWCESQQGEGSRFFVQLPPAA
ncbi:hybrid sensor histidine kinase/response regulator [uncultured Roseovarius sp.]|uniref:hybrid sensor histidine kinase/response regulator n=1 Tax=uncultured Roseovarius sp. TaxID=293344 RepID=UPI002615B587|nr:hybrid sensor histidine kinase/response regulator [uncultured Roseovarius sp.]